MDTSDMDVLEERPEGVLSASCLALMGVVRKVFAGVQEYSHGVVLDFTSRVVGIADAVCLSINEIVRDGMAYKEAVSEYYKVLMEDLRDAWRPVAQSAGVTEQSVMSWAKRVSDPLKGYMQDRLANLLAGVDMLDTKLAVFVDTEIYEWNQRIDDLLRQENGNRSDFYGRVDRWELEEGSTSEFEDYESMKNNHVRSRMGVVVVDGHLSLPLWANELPYVGTRSGRCNKAGVNLLDGVTKQGKSYSGWLVERRFLIDQMKGEIMRLIGHKGQEYVAATVQEEMSLRREQLVSFVGSELKECGLTNLDLILDVLALKFAWAVRDKQEKKSGERWEGNWDKLLRWTRSRVVEEGVPAVGADPLFWLSLLNSEFVAGEVPGWAWAYAFTMRDVHKNVATARALIKGCGHVAKPEKMSDRSRHYKELVVVRVYNSEFKDGRIREVIPGASRPAQSKDIDAMLESCPDVE